MESQFARRPWKWRFFGSKGFLFREDPLFFPMQENETIRRPLNRSTTRCHVLSTSEITVAPFPPPSTPFRNVTRARNRNGPLFLSRQLKLLPSFPEHCPRAFVSSRAVIVSPTFRPFSRSYLIFPVVPSFRVFPPSCPDSLSPSPDSGSNSSSSSSDICPFIRFFLPARSRNDLPERG